MRENSRPAETAEKHVRDIRRATRKKYSTEDRIQIVLSGSYAGDWVTRMIRRRGEPAFQ
jgi:transposase